METFVEDDMCESDWMEIDWPLEHLQNTYRFSTLMHRREHAFFKYWRHVFFVQRVEPTRSHLEEMERYQDWGHVVGGLMGDLARQERLTTQDAEWLLAWMKEAPLQGAYAFGIHQLTGLLTWRDETLDWREKLTRCLHAKAYWAAEKVLESLATEDRDEARRILLEANLPKKVWQSYLKHL